MVFFSSQNVKAKRTAQIEIKFNFKLNGIYPIDQDSDG